ncbi:hypothetical protein BDB00DRAFT_319041 [Zychaea mexicana]|uniref:uncharacterized protein n=1 Tax=Zychaea mexicana TaxID=64656 RepID=UPI0022FEE087|nr:uncharacterized protein BDB00DRAFT_319041 [Zychaea mexicana]KAI9494277.1 hypothetical protein BDB00DRAFT_319041 [Zychaea mexicana]
MEKPFSLQSPLAAKDANRRIPLASRDTNRKSRLATKDPNRKRTSLPSKNTDRRDPLTSKDADRRNPRAAVKDADRRNTINRSKDSCPRRSLASIDTNRPLQSRETHIKQSKNLDPRLIVMTNRERNDKYTEAVLQRSNTTRNQSISLTATTLTEGETAIKTVIINATSDVKAIETTLHC